MKVLLAGAFGNLGADILKKLIKDGHEVVAADMVERDLGIEKKYEFKQIDVTNPETLKGICDGCEAVITTVGLTKGSATVTPYEIDYQGNLNLLNEAKAAGVKKFNYISVISCDEPGADKVPMLHAKYLFEEELKKSGLEYIIHRPTGYFYDIAKVFKPYVDNGEMQLLKGFGGVKANVIDCPDFAKFIVDTLGEVNVTYNVGGKETYTYEEKDFEYKSDGTYVHFRNINASQMSEPILVAVYRDGVQVSNTISYSIESYAYSKQNDTTTPYLASLVKRMLCYGDSCKAYVGN